VNPSTRLCNKASTIERPIARRDKVEKSGTVNSTPISFSNDWTNPWVCRNGWWKISPNVRQVSIAKSEYFG